MLTEGGFSLQNGTGMLAGRAVGASLSNKRPRTDLPQPESDLYKTESLSNHNDISLAIESKVKDFTSSRLTAWIG
jgi:hypothetical protein